MMITPFSIYIHSLENTIKPDSVSGFKGYRFVTDYSVEISKTGGFFWFSVDSLFMGDSSLYSIQKPKHTKNIHLAGNLNSARVVVKYKVTVTGWNGDTLHIVTDNMFKDEKQHTGG